MKLFKFLIKKKTREQKVLEFNRLIQFDVAQLPSRERFKLRINLIQEELNELKKSFSTISKRANNKDNLNLCYTENDLVNIVDHLCDIQYVLSGTVIEFGLTEVFDKAFDEVHRSNMTKSVDSYAKVLDQIDIYKNLGIECGYAKIDDTTYVLIRLSDKKLMKPNSYDRANLLSFGKYIFNKFKQ